MSFKIEVIDKVPETAVRYEKAAKAGSAKSLLQQIVAISKPMRLEFQKRSTMISRINTLAKKQGYKLEIRRDISNPKVFYLRLEKR